MSKIITVLDLGSRGLAAAMAEITPDGRVKLLALENADSNGINGGGVTSLNKTVRDISGLMRKIQSRSGKKPKNVMVTIGGADIKMIPARGMVPLSGIPRQITAKDVRKCLKIAAMLALPAGRICVERIVKRFYIDGAPTGIRDPVGLYGIKLEAEIFAATANHSKIQSIIKCVDHAGFLVEGVYLSCTASAGCILSAEEKSRGVLFADIGNSFAETLIFKGNILRNFEVVPDWPAGAFNPEKLAFSSLVLTGPGALPNGVIEEAGSRFNVPARIGIVRKAGFNLNSQDAIIHTATIGLITRRAREYKNVNADKNPVRKIITKIIDLYEAYF